MLDFDSSAALTPSAPSFSDASPSLSCLSSSFDCSVVSGSTSTSISSSTVYFQQTIDGIISLKYLKLSKESSNLVFNLPSISSAQLFAEKNNADPDPFLLLKYSDNCSLASPAERALSKVSVKCLSNASVEISSAKTTFCLIHFTLSSCKISELILVDIVNSALFYNAVDI